MNGGYTKWAQNLVCPYSEGALTWVEEKQELWCKKSGRAYRFEDGMAVMLIDKARKLSKEEMETVFGG
jgi:uncharacterized protein YbaR (Trm112 family)